MRETPDTSPDDEQFTLLGPSPIAHAYDTAGTTGTTTTTNPADAWESAPGTVDAETLVSRRSSPRKRAVQVGLVAICALVVFGLLRSTASLLPHPQATATPAATDASQQLIGIIANVSYGAVTVDGKKLSGSPPFAFRPKPEGDTVTFSAPPFATHTCSVQISADGSLNTASASDNNCAYGSSSGVPVTSGGRTVFVDNYIEFDFGVDDLPDDLKASALALVQQSIKPVSVTTTVPAGQYYASGRNTLGMIQSRLATSPLTAKVTLAIPSAQQMTGPNNFCTEIICSGGGPFVDQYGQVQPLPQGKYWNVYIPLAISWLFLTADGRVVGSENDGESGGGEGGVLQLDDSEHWHFMPSLQSSIGVEDDLRQQLPEDICNSETSELYNALQNEQVGNSNMSPDDPNNTNGLVGCLIHITESDGTTVLGTVIWRFGVLLAADAKTHKAYPWLPLAPKAEVDAVTAAN